MIRSVNTLDRIKYYWRLFWLLTKTDLIVLRQVIVGQFINVIFWSSSIVIVSAFVYPKLGMTDKFAEFIVISAIVTHSFWGIWDSSYKILEDIETKKVIDYNLTLPIPSWLVIFQKGIRHSIVRAFPCLIVLPFFKLLLGSRIDLSQFSIFKFSFIFITIMVFMGFLFLFISSFVKSSHSVDTVGIRLLFPMWFFGATQYSWSVMHSVNSKVGYLILANPLVYVMEALHASVSGPKGFIPFWICVLVLWVCIFVFGFVGILRFKKRLDFV